MCKQLLLLSSSYCASMSCCSKNIIFIFPYVPKRGGEGVCNEARLYFREET